VRTDREEMQKLYYSGLSLSQVGKVYSLTRQSVYETLLRFKTTFRKKVFLPFVIYDNKKWTISKTTRYYRSTTNRKRHISLHRCVWEKERGKIPIGYDIHHINEDKTNNDINNLQCLLKSEHTRLHYLQDKNYEISKDKNE